MFLHEVRGWKRQFMMIFCGAATSFALSPFHFIIVGFLTFPILIIVLDGVAEISNLKRRIFIASMTCWSFGFGYFVFALWWLSHAMLIDPIAFAWAIPFAVLGLPAYLALYWALAGCLAMMFWYPNAARFLALGFAFGAGEWFRGTLLTGFPWASIGYTLMPTPLLMQSAAILGLYGINALAVLCYSLATVLFTDEKKLFSLSLLMVLIGAHIGFGVYRMHNLPNVENYKTAERWVRIVQPSIQQTNKMDVEDRQKTFEMHLDLSEAPIKKGSKKPDFIVWPETSVPYILDYVPAAKMRIADMLTNNQWAIVGSVRTDGRVNQTNKHYYNTIEVVNHHGQILASSDKVHLVPFGEYLPYQKLFDAIGLKAIADDVGGYSPADQRRSVTMPNDFTYLPMICYEIIFPDGMDYHGNKPQAILNVTNDAWFGMTPGPYQHLDQARLRAVELGLPLIRAANNGISAVVDPYGRIVQYLKQNEVDFVDSPIPDSIVPYWNNGPQSYHAFVIIFLLLVSNLLLRRTKTGNHLTNIR